MHYILICSKRGVGKFAHSSLTLPIVKTRGISTPGHVIVRASVLLI